MVTAEAAGVFHLQDGEGKVLQGGVADLVVVKDGGMSPASTLLSLDRGALRIVMAGGEVRLVSQSFASRLPAAAVRHLQPIVVEDGGGDTGFLVAATIPEILRSAESILGAVRLTGRRVYAGCL
jgi:hypothetical protein